MTVWHYILIALGFYVSFRLGQASILMLLKEEVRDRILRGASVDTAVNSLVASDDTAQATETQLEIERVGTNYYAYATSGEFLAQGQNFQDMFQQIQQRFPNKQFRVNRLNSELTEQESTEMIRAIFQVFGGRSAD